MLNTKKIKQDFPIFSNHLDLVYLDSASTSQKPQQVIDAVTNFYTKTNANIHRGIYKLAEEATERYENVRTKVAELIRAKAEEIIFTKNTNEAINIVALGWAKKHLKRGDIVVLSEMEHHANIVPWLRLKEEVGVKLHFLPLDEEFRLNYKSILTANIDLSKIKIASLTHTSNALGTINPIAEIIAFFKRQGVNAKFVIDAAQSAPHIQVNVEELDCDFLAFSSHKMLGPSGVGVLWGKRKLLEETEPLLVGSHMIKSVDKDKALWTDAPWKFEVGTANLEGVVGLGAAIDYIKKIGIEQIASHEKELTEYGLKKIKEIEGLKLYGPDSSINRLGIFSFSLDNIHPHDIAQILDRFGVGIRSGHHCAQPLMECLGVAATARASVYIYNDKNDIDKLVEGLKEVRKTMKI